MAFALSTKVIASRPTARVAARRAAPSVRPVVFVRSQQLDKAVQEALKNAEAECEQKGTNSKDCEVAWDQAEELLAAKNDKKVTDQANSDPLEAFCKDNEDADECRVHDN